MSLNSDKRSTPQARESARDAADPAFALVRRAVVEDDAASWQALKRLYRPQLLAWSRSAGVSAGQTAELAALAWEKFATHFTAAKLEAAAGVAGVRRYLKLCVHCAAIDLARAGRGGAAALPSPLPIPDGEPGDRPA